MTAQAKRALLVALDDRRDRLPLPRLRVGVAAPEAVADRGRLAVGGPLGCGQPVRLLQLLGGVGDELDVPDQRPDPRGRRGDVDGGLDGGALGVAHRRQPIAAGSLGAIQRSGAGRVSRTRRRKRSCRRASPVCSGWNAVAITGPWRTATTLPDAGPATLPGTRASTSTPRPVDSTHGARMNTARTGPPATPVTARSDSNDCHLPAERVAAHGDVEGAELVLVGTGVDGLAREQDHARAGAERRHPGAQALTQRLEQVERPRAASTASSTRRRGAPGPRPPRARTGRRTGTASAPQARSASRCSGTLPCRARTPTGALTTPV